ncbi:MAG: AI-2E family transporter [Clostridia bacterium]|nr:AI-2E family transporter [Clostridia bacterium]
MFVKPKWTTVLLAVAGGVALFLILFNFAFVKEVVGNFLSVLEPLWAGILIAYLLCPMAEFFEKQCARFAPIAKAARQISVLLTAIIVFAVIGLLAWVLIPQLWSSIVDLLPKLPNMVEVQFAKLQTFMASESSAATYMTQILDSAENSLMTWLKTNLVNTITNIANSVVSIGSAIVTIMLTVIITIYLLLDRERYLSQCRKLFHAVSKNERVNDEIDETIKQAHRIFSGFISGKLLDSLIVGIICFIVLSILQMPYALLISVVIGVTNVIPMFGPFIGAIPSAFLLLLVSPKQCLVFIIFIVILQQIDGNIIGPRIIGNSTGISALYVTIAILLFGKLFGFIGMILGVPLFATIYYIVKRLTEHSLRNQGLPIETSRYLPGLTIHGSLPENSEEN